MRVIVVYKDKTDYARTVTDFLSSFERQTGHVLETMDPDLPNSQFFCTTYDIVEYPTIIAISDSGELQNSWRGLPLPTISEVSYYVQ